MPTSSSQATQRFVPIKEIKNDVVVLRDGGYRGVLLCSSVNFGLKSVDEQRAIISGFQTLLNTLDFSIQILVNSRKMDIRPYITLLEGKGVEQRTELLRIQLREYIEFVRTFTDQQNIMTKMFYVIIPYTSSASSQVAQVTSIFGKKEAGAKTSSENSFEEARVQLEQRLALVASGLSGCGIRATMLGTEELIELFYRSFNPGELENPIRIEA